MDMAGNGVEREVVHQLERLFGHGTVTGLSEEQLLDRFAASRDESAFEALVERHGPMVLGVCRQFLRDPNDVDDAFQATFLVLVRKAGSLRQKDLLGNWLYGVASKVALRSRTVGIRRQMRVSLSEQVEGLAANRGSSRSEPVSEAVLRDEECPLVHEEVNRLPRKYRTPIVLCYFEGLTHDQAAAKLGWPVGTVKGRLSRARDLLRTRLSRRGVEVSSAALAAYLTGAELRASVPASLTHLTLNAALAVVAQGSAAITASSAVSLPVASLTEGVVQTMVLSQVKSIVIPLLVAAGVLTTGASVVAFQFGGFSGYPEDPVQNRPHGSPASASRKATAPTPASSSPAQGEVQIARQILDDLQNQTRVRELNDPETYHTWSLRLLEAEKREASENSPPIGAYETHVHRMTRMLQLAENRAKTGQQSSYDVARWKYFAKEAERMLDEAKGTNPGGMMMGNMMSRMISTGGVRAPMGGMPMMTGGSGGSGGPKANQPKATEAAASAGAQAQAQAGAQGVGGGAALGVGGVVGGGFVGGVGGGGAGGFGGGGADDSVEVERAARIQIARMSGVVSTLDKNSHNIAVIQKLEEPVTLHFPLKTPLEEVLKHVKDATKGADGKRLSIYVDPEALEEAEKTLASPVTIDLEDVPLRFALRLVLKQLGLAYCIRDGVVIISTVDGIQQELREAQAEQLGLNPEKFPMGGMGGMNGGMGGMGGGMR